MARYWIADLHLGHDKVAKIRGFEDASYHDEIITSQLTNLKSGDEVWVLGDISSGKPEDEDYALGTLQNITVFEGVRFHLIAGNHDSVSSIHRNGFKKQAVWLDVFDSIQQFAVMKLNGARVLMSHYPYSRSGDGPGRGSARYKEFRLPDTGMPLIHGHTHHTEKHMDLYGDWEQQVLEPGESKVADTQQFCVSWDAHRRLVTEHDLNQWIEGIK